MRSRRVITSVFLFMFGLLAGIPILTRPRVATYQGSDVVQLPRSGWCFGLGCVLPASLRDGR